MLTHLIGPTPDRIWPRHVQSKWSTHPMGALCLWCGPYDWLLSRLPHFLGLWWRQRGSCRTRHTPVGWKDSGCSWASSPTHKHRQPPSFNHMLFHWLCKCPCPIREMFNQSPSCTWLHFSAISQTRHTEFDVKCTFLASVFFERTLSPMLVRLATVSQRSYLLYVAS